MKLPTLNFRGENIATAPNCMTLWRWVASTTVAVLLPIYGAGWILGTINMVWSILDYTDGWWARKYNCVTKLGKVLDPVVDAYSYVVILWSLIYSNPGSPARWLMISLLLVNMTYMGDLLRTWNNIPEWWKDKLSASMSAKVKTAVNMTALSILSYFPVDSVGWIAGMSGLVVGTGFTLACWKDYREQVQKIQKEYPQ